MAFSPRSAAAWLKKWAEAGINVAIVNSGLEALEKDKAEAVSRVRKVTGRLAATIRVVKPSSRSAATRAGQLIFRLGAGKRGSDRRTRVPYGRVLQTGLVYGSSDGKTRAHDIQARAGAYAAGKFRTTGVLAFRRAGGVAFAHSVHHPGSKFTAHPYIDLNQARFAKAIDDGLQRSADQAAARSSEFEGLGGS